MSKPRVSSTDSVHAGTTKKQPSNSITPPIVHSAPFVFGSTQELVEYVEGRSTRVQAEYGRMANPTVMAVEQRLAALEGAQQAQLFASGMAAVTTLLLTLLQNRDHIILTSDSYRRTRDFGFFLAKFGVRMDVVKPDAEAVIRAIQPTTRLIFTEIPTNPFLHVIDLPKVAQAAKANNVLLVADSTFATPVNFRPLEVGADIVIHSATKYLAGHNDVIAGVLAGNSEVVQPVKEMLMTLGGICDPNSAFLLGRGLKTLALRVKHQNESAIKVAQYLEGHPKIEQVLYPGLPSHPCHEQARNLMQGFGGVITFLVKGGFEEAARFIDSLKIPYIAPSLGGVEALIEQPALMSFWNLEKRQREALGIRDSLIRLALGIEEAEDIIADLEQGLSRI